MPMKTLCYYISDHGYGHAARSIAIIRELLARDEVEVIVKTAKPLGFVRASLRGERVRFCEQENDFGFVLKRGSLAVDREATLRNLKKWLSRWEEYIRRERRFLEENRIDLVISDIAPQPFIAAEEAGIASVAISNFTWDEMYRAIVGEREEVSAIRDAYGKASEGLLLPFALENITFRKSRRLSLVARQVTQSRERIRERLGIGKEEKLVYFGLGMSVASCVAGKFLKDDIKARILAPEKLGFKNAVKIPKGETESQNYIAACDLVVSKAGYSTVAEAISARVPLLLINREEIPEDRKICEDVVRLGVGRSVKQEENLSEKINEMLETEFSLNLLPEEMENKGAGEAAEYIAQLL